MDIKKAMAIASDIRNGSRNIGEAEAVLVLAEAVNRLMPAREYCEHKSVFWDLDDTAKCVACNEDLGWYCQESPKRYCEYFGGECCVHCGDPEERQ